MSKDITVEDVRKWKEELAKQTPKESRVVKLWAGENSFDNMPDEMFISMCEDKRIILHTTKAAIKKIRDRYKKLKQ